MNGLTDDKKRSVVPTAQSIWRMCEFREGNNNSAWSFPVEELLTLTSTGR